MGLAWLAAPLAVGLALRMWNWREQILGDDELHAVRAALAMPLEQILVTWRQTDHSLPLTALYRVWLDAGGVLSDGVLRAPVLLASLVLLLLAPRLLAPLAGVRLARLWCWLLAISPLLVSYGRVVRSYSVALALSTCGLLAFARYWRGGGPRFGVAYVGCGALAIFFHLGAGPFVVVPLAVAVLLCATGSDGARPGPGSLLGIAVGLLLAGAALLAPGATTLLALVEAKRAVGGLTLEIAGEVLRLHAGTSYGVLAAAFWAAAVAGAVVLWQRGQRLLALLVPGAPLGQGVGLWLLAPELDSTTLAARAFLVTLPMSLLGAAAGIDAALVRLDSAVVARRGPQQLSRAAALAGLAAIATLAGPFLDRGFWRTSFRQHDDYLVFTRSRPRLGPDALPAFYRDLAERPEGALIELPWHPFWGFGHAVPAYQEQHGRAVFVANAEPLSRDRRVALRRYVSVDPGAMLASGGRYAVVHLDLEREEAAARAARGGPDPTRPHPRIWQALRREAARARQTLDATFGPSDYDDGVVVVWDLGRIRSS